MSNIRILGKQREPEPSPMCATHRKQTHAGFTLIEALVVIALVGILVGIAVPSFTTFITRTRQVTQANEFVLALMYAKSEAIKRNSAVRVCSTTDAATCNGTADWSSGWLVVDASDTVLQAHPALEGNNTLTAGTRTTVTFANTGFSAGSNDTFTLCTPGTTTGRAIVLSAQGRAQNNAITTCP